MSIVLFQITNLLVNLQGVKMNNSFDFWQIVSWGTTLLGVILLYIQLRDKKELWDRLARIHDMAHETIQRDTDWKDKDGDIHSQYSVMKTTVWNIRAITRKTTSWNNKRWWWFWC